MSHALCAFRLALLVSIVASPRAILLAQGPAIVATIHGSVPSEALGSQNAIASLGDVTGDGVPDFVAGSPGWPMPHPTLPGQTIAVSVRPDAPLEEEGRRRMRGRARRRTSAPRLEAPSGDQAFAAAAADSRAAFQAAGVSAATALCGCSEIRFSTSTSQTYGSTPARRQEYMSV
jgi:hypothetical protein